VPAKAPVAANKKEESSDNSDSDSDSDSMDVVIHFTKAVEEALCLFITF
jgi:hypothetical protein